MTAEATQSIGEHRRGPKRVLVLGSTGMVGRAWCELLDREGIEHRGVSRPEFDLLNRRTVCEAINPGEDLVVNAAAWTDVDGAESDPDAAMQANADSVGLLSGRCHALGATLIHYSTDYVFNGRAERPYPINAEIDPCNAYGKSKAAGEELIRHQGTPDHIIIRTSWVYAPWGKNFVRTIAKFAAEKPELRVVDDQRGRPTSAEQLAATSLALHRSGARGVWHATDGGECTWHELATLIAARVNPSCVVHPCSSEEYPRPAFRPPYSVLNIEATETLCGPMRSWQESVEDVLSRLEETK
ncbi:MAG: dTDP-4-dehydrorhamnose reductase [Phycisphaerales bacterium]|nr:dTDP-4-dehydrorhamnose reductase [Phycisphaerales bacterium]